MVNMVNQIWYLNIAIAISSNVPIRISVPVSRKCDNGRYNYFFYIFNPEYVKNTNDF